MYAEIYQEDYTLFDYQSQSKKSIFSAWDKYDSVMFQMPTGTGKTRLFTSIVRDLLKWGIMSSRRVKILIIAHRKELVDQICDCLGRYQISHGKIIGGEAKNLEPNVLVASIQTLSQSKNQDLYLGIRPDFVIIDEAHHSIATTYTNLWELYPMAKYLGVTATPWSMEMIGFDNIYDDIITSMQPKEFIQRGRLAPYDYYSIKDTNAVYERIHKIREFDKDGDFTRKALQRAFDTVAIRAKLLDSYLKYASGKKGIIYSICRTHSKHICEEYQSAGIRITDIDGSTPKQERQQKIEDFKSGKLDIIVNVDIFSEGFDCPDIEFIQLARPTKSLVKYIQQVGRGLRVSKNKERCIILDNVGALYDFGLPDDDRDWIQYFHGRNQLKPSDSTANKSADEFGTKHRKVNLSEGHEEMVKIIGSENMQTFRNTDDEEQKKQEIEKLIEINKQKFLKEYGKRSKR